MTFIVELPAKQDRAALLKTVERTIAGHDILRIKGIAAFREKGGKPAVMHAVQNKFYPVSYLEDWPDDDHTSRLVFIGRHLNTQRIDELFAALCV